MFERRARDTSSVDEARQLAEQAEEDREFYRWYGPWDPLTPAQVADRMAGVGVPWWIVGGWAVEAFTGRGREHEDVDVAFLRADLGRVLEHLSQELCVWSNLGGTLRPLRRPDDLLDGARQLWVRRDGASPWLMDLAMTPHEGETWIAPGDARISRPLDEATFTAEDGIRYLRPELVLFMKAKLTRPKDAADLLAILPALDASARAWLRDAIDEVHPGHPWLTEMAAAPPRD